MMNLRFKKLVVTQITLSQVFMLLLLSLNADAGPKRSQPALWPLRAAENSPDQVELRNETARLATVLVTIKNDTDKDGTLRLLLGGYDNSGPFETWSFIKIGPGQTKELKLSDLRSEYRNTSAPISAVESATFVPSDGSSEIPIIRKGSFSHQSISAQITINTNVAANTRVANRNSTTRRTSLGSSSELNGDFGRRGAGPAY